MRSFLLFAIVIIMSILVAETAAKTLPVPQAVTDPKQISSKPNAQVEPRSLTIEKLYMTRQIGRPTWSPDGKSIAFVANMSGRNNLRLLPDHARKPVDTNTRQDRGNYGIVWSKDGRYIVYTQEQAKGTDSNIFIADVATGKSTLLTPHEGEQRYYANDIDPRAIPDGRRILITSNAANGYDNIGLLEFGTKGELSGVFTPGKITWLTHDKWEIRGGEFSPDGKHITFSANVDGNEDIYLHDLATGKSTVLAISTGVNEAAGGHSAFSPDGQRLLYNHNGPAAPGDLWTYTRATRKLPQFTHSLVHCERS